MKVTAETARTILEHHFGKFDAEIEEVSGGLANFTYKASIGGAAYVVRIGEEQSKLQYFLKEQWAATKVREARVPVPNILEVGNEASKFPYMIVEWVDGIPATVWPDRIGVVEEMGEYAALIHSIETSGYGHVFDWSSNQLSRNDSWRDYLMHELEISERIELFERYRIFGDEGTARLRSAAKEVMNWSHKPCLNHGDLRLKNVIVDEKGRICAILDWETCVSSVAPYWDMSIALHDLSIDEKDAFIEGYGLSRQEYRNRALGIKFFNIMNYAPVLQAALEEKKEESRKEAVETVKARLRGDLDLYSL